MIGTTECDARPDHEYTGKLNSTESGLPCAPWPIDLQPVSVNIYTQITYSVVFIFEGQDS